MRTSARALRLRSSLVPVCLAILGVPAWGAAPVPVGAEFHVNTYTTSHQKGASVAMDACGDFVVVWDSR